MNSCFLLLILLCIQPVSFSKPLSTVDRLKIDHSLPDEFIEEESARCNMSKLCSYDEMNVETICGTDGRTYNSFCEIKRAICHGNPVDKKLDGPCPENMRCLLERSFQMNLAEGKLNSTEIFIPECNASDGSYANVQCHKSTGYCWCVTRLGRPLASTSVKNERPDCQNAHTSKVERRSHRKNNRKSSSNDVCSTLERSAFNVNLFQLFKNEFGRVEDSDDSQAVSLDKRIISWKFAELDTNKDETLSRKEMGGFRRLVRKLAQPKSCAKKFPRYCDLNKDKLISAREWITCLGVDLTSDLNMAQMLGVPMTKAKIEEVLRNETDDGDGGTSSNDAVDDINNEEEHADCRTQRAQAMKKLQLNPNSGNYVPTCTGDNDMLYDRIQCHRSSQFCWCVNPETGIPLPGKSKYNGKPDCTVKDIRVPVVETNREIKGCIGKKKAKFFQRLFSSLTSEWIMATNDDSNGDPSSSRDKAVRWKFASLDTNNNNRLERREWKPYREELKQLNKLRKCGRNFMRFCDRDGDRRITVDEWIDCTLNVDATMPVSKPKLMLQRKKNPFLEILKPED